MTISNLSATISKKIIDIQNINHEIDNELKEILVSIEIIELNTNNIFGKI
jgi:hypothetical protein